MAFINTKERSKMKTKYFFSIIAFLLAADIAKADPTDWELHHAFSACEQHHATKEITVVPKDGSPAKTATVETSDYIPEYSVACENIRISYLTAKKNRKPEKMNAPDVINSTNDKVLHGIER